jgi:F0F1-type ATP synthase membrane subunit b/b'
MNIVAIIMLGAALVRGIGNIFSNAAARDKEAKEAKYQLDQLNAYTTATLNAMDAELASNKEADFIKATAIERGATEQFTANMQNTYLSQLSAESSYMDQLAASNDTMGKLQTAAGTSGARTDTMLMGITKSILDEQNKTTRTSIDATRDSNVATGLASVNEAKTQANELRAQYDEGSAYMALFNTKRQGIIDAANVKKTYLQSVYKDATTYDWWDFGADFFGFTTPITGTVADMASQGVFGKI